MNKELKDLLTNKNIRIELCQNGYTITCGDIYDDEGNGLAKVFVDIDEVAEFVKEYFENLREKINLAKLKE